MTALLKAMQPTNFMHTLPHGVHGLHNLSVRWVERLISQQAKEGLCHRLA